jgi:transposase-like protein
MNMKVKEDYELIAKHCPACESLVMAKVELESDGKMKYRGYKCSQCDWTSPANEHIK